MALMFNKIILTIMGLLLALLIATGYGLYAQIGVTAALKSEVTALNAASERAAVRLKKDAKALAAREAKIAAQGRKLAEAQTALSAALQQEKDWSDTQVPDSVQKALNGPPGGPDSGLLDSPDRP
jgi:hypothetical protein